MLELISSIVQSEKAMGEAIKKFGWKRNDLVVSTKVNY
jgi:diketogulonate reductase-like aldo/keto reductase